MAGQLEMLLAGLNDANSFENNFEAENFISDVKKMSPTTQKLVLNAVKERNGIVKHIGQGENHGEIYSLIANSKGDLNLTVTRSGVNIDAPLPYILFGSNDFSAGYFDTLSTLTKGLPAGTTVAVTTSASGDIVFTYTLAGNSDTVTISNLGNISYRNFLAGMNNNYFATRYFLTSISDEDQSLLQFSQPLFFGELSVLGMSKANQLVFRSRTNSWQFRKDRIEVVLPEQKVTPDFSFACSIVKVDGFTMGFDFFMSQRLNLNSAVR